MGAKERGMFGEPTLGQAIGEVLCEDCASDVGFEDLGRGPFALGDAVDDLLRCKKGGIEFSTVRPRRLIEAGRLTGRAQVSIFRTLEIGQERTGPTDTEGVLALRELPGRDFDVGWGGERPHDLGRYRG